MDALNVFRPERAVSARELARRTSHLLNELEETGHSLAVVRFGRIVAVLAPMEDGPRVGAEWKPKLPQHAIDLDRFDLTGAKREVFDAVAGEPSGVWSMNTPLIGRTVSEILNAGGMLELDGLVERFGAGLRLTKIGRRVAEKPADQVSVRSAAERDG